MAMMKGEYCPRCGAEKNSIKRSLKDSWFDDFNDEIWVPAECEACGLEYDAVYRFNKATADELEEDVFEGDHVGPIEPDYELERLEGMRGPA